MVVVFAVILVVVALYGIAIYNRLALMRQQFEIIFGQVNSQIERRHEAMGELLVRLEQTCQADAHSEWLALREACEVAVAACASACGKLSDSAVIRQIGEAEQGLSAAFQRLLANLDSATLVSLEDLRETIVRLDDRISFARQSFNDAVTLYNTTRRGFPANAFAALMRCLPAERLRF